MGLIHELFYHNLDVVFFIYGLAFIVMGIAVLVQPKKGSDFKIANVLWLLALFGITHGINEELDMWSIIKGRNPTLDVIRWMFLVISYVFLFEFGRQLFSLHIAKAPAWRRKVAVLFGWKQLPFIGIFILVAGLFASDFWSTGSIWTRYLLGFPGSILIGLGFTAYYNHERETLRPLKVKKYFSVLSISFFIYGILGGLIVPKGHFFPSSWLNTDSFLLTVKIPVQVIRAVCAIITAWAVSGILKIFNWEIRSKLEEAQVLLKQQLRESEERYMEIVEGSSDVIHSIDTEGIIICTNRQGYKSLGYAQTELIGKHIKDICGDDTWHALKKGFEKLILEGAVFIDAGKLFKKNGEELDVAIHSMAMYDSKKHLVGARLTMRDITERRRAEEALRESEEKYRLLFEESRDAIYITSRDGQFMDINQSALDLFGYTKEELLGLSVSELYVNHRDRIRFQQEIEHRGFVRDYTAIFRKKDGTEIDCIITSTIRSDSSGRIMGYQGIIRDITHLKKIEEELLKIEKLESVGILAGGIAHDFNNLLTTILGNISLAKISANSGKSVDEILKDAERACLHAKDLTKQLLTFSKGGAPIKHITSIGELLKDSANFALRGSNVRCEFSVPDDLLPVEIDEGQIRQVINNLVINAYQAMPHGGTIRISAGNIDVTEEERSTLRIAEGEYVKISISDQGGGIPEKFLLKIFDPYFTTKQKGSGLGLTTTYSIIKSHDGHINVESEVGVGTTFHIYLPASREKFAMKQAKIDQPLKGGGKILLMEDEESVQRSVSKVLKHLGYEVETARDGEEAIDLYKQAEHSEKPFDVVLMDLTIRGGMGGKETIKKLIELNPHVKAIVSSGYSNDPIMANPKQYGFNSVITKPYEIEDLSELLYKVINEKNS